MSNNDNNMTMEQLTKAVQKLHSELNAAKKQISNHMNAPNPTTTSSINTDLSSSAAPRVR